MADAWWKRDLDTFLNDRLDFVLLNITVQAETQNFLIFDIIIRFRIILEYRRVRSDDLEAMVFLWLFFIDLIGTNFTKVV